MYMREKFGLTILLVIFAAFFMMSGELDVKVRVYPYFVCFLGFIFTAIQLGITVWKGKNKIPLDSSPALNLGQIGAIIITFVAAFAYVYLSDYVGFFTMTFIYVVGFSYWHTRTCKWWLYPLVALGVDFVVYVAFAYFLNMPLPEGFLI